MEGGVKTLLLGGSTKKKLSAGERGGGSGRSKYFITGREHTNKLSAGGGEGKKE